MGSHNFTWSHPANEVFITGTFDNWSKSVRLDNHNGVFSKKVDLPSATDNVYYKFVVDGNWVTDHTAAGEHDYSGNWNNVLKAHDITPHPAPQTTHDTRPAPRGAASYMPTKHMPGAFPPETPMNEAPGFSMTPLPASSGRDQAPGEQEERAFGVSPLPASSGVSNPISLRPGESVPSSDTFTSHTLESNVHHDRESFERSDALPQDSFQGQSGSLLSTQLPASSRNMIPESSLPMGSRDGEDMDAGPFMRSAGAGTSTAELAGQVPRESRGVPEIVRESQHQAHVDPEASASAEAVAEKREVEQELKRQVSPQSPASEGNAGQSGGVTSGRYGGSTVPYNDLDDYRHATGISTGVPETVTESQHQAHVDPEATASAAAVSHKQAMEQELKRTVSREPEIQGSPATGYGESSSAANAVPNVVSESQHRAQVDPEASASSDAVAHKQAMERELQRDVSREPATKESSAGDYGSNSSSGAAVPTPVSESQRDAQVDPEASASSGAVAQKQDVEDELLEKVPEQPATAQSGLLNSTNLSHQAAHVGEIATHAGVLAFAGGAALLGAAAAGVSAITHSIPHGTQNASHGGLPSSISNFISSMNIGGGNHSNTQSSPQTTTQGVPQPVSDSIARSGESPEAAVNPEAVSEKSSMEKELLAEVPTTNETGERAPSYAQEDTPNALFGSTAARGGHGSHEGGISSYTPVPEPVTESYERAHRDPEAAANPEAVAEKSAFERELLREVPRSNEAGEPAPSDSAALSATAPSASRSMTSESYNGSGAGQAYMGGGTTGQTIASYIPGTEANAASKNHDGSSSYLGGSLGATIASYIPGTEANAASKAHDGSSGYVGGSTGETIASYIPGTQANAASKDVAHSNQEPSTTSGEASQDSSDPFATDPVTAAGGVRSVPAERYAVPLHTVDAFRDDPVSASQTSTSATHSSSDPFANDPVTAAGGARSVPADRHAVPLHTVDAFRDDPVSASQTSASRSQDSEAHTHGTSSSIGQGLIGGSIGQTIASYIPGTHANAASKEGSRNQEYESYDRGASSSEGPYTHGQGQGQGYVGGSTGETIASYIPGTQANAASKEVPHSQGYESYNQGTSSTHDSYGQERGYVGGSTGETIASYIPGTQANAASKAASGRQEFESYSQESSSHNQGPLSSGQEPYSQSQGHVGGSTGETIASYIPGTQANAASKETSASHSSDYVGGSTGETVASYIPGTDANAASKASYGQGSSSYSQGPSSYGQGSTSYTQENTTYSQGPSSYDRGYSSYDDDGYDVTSYAPTGQQSTMMSFISSLPQGGPLSAGALTASPTSPVASEAFPTSSGSGFRDAEIGGAGLMTAAAVAGSHSLETHAPAHTTTYTSQGGSGRELSGSSEYNAPTSSYEYESPASTSAHKASAGTSAYDAPASTSAYEAPASTSAYETPTYASPMHTSAHEAPKDTSAYEAHSTASAYETPAHASSYEAPKDTSVYDAPAHTSAHEVPVHSSTYEVPATNSAYEAPATTSAYEATSAYESRAATSAYGASKSTSAYEAPANTSAYETPANALTYEAPASSSAYEAIPSSSHEPSMPSVPSALATASTSAPIASAFNEPIPSTRETTMTSAPSALSSSEYTAPIASTRETAATSAPIAPASSMRDTPITSPTSALTSSEREATVPSPTSIPREGGALSSARAAMASVRKSTSSARKPSASTRPMSTSTGPIAGSSISTPSGLNTMAPSGLSAPASYPAQSGATEVGPIVAQPASGAAAAAAAASRQPAASGSAMKEAMASKSRNDSRDVSPFSKNAAAGGSTAATGGVSASTGGASASTGGWQQGQAGAAASSSSPSTPQRTAGQASGSGRSTPATQDDKKSKRRSFFGKIKDKLRN